MSAYGPRRLGYTARCDDCGVTLDVDDLAYVDRGIGVQCPDCFALDHPTHLRVRRAPRALDPHNDD